MLFLIRRMHLVTGSAATPFLLLVHMKEMEVPTVVAEVRKRSGSFILRDCPVVTLEAQIVVLFCIWHVKFFGEILLQYPMVLAPMRIVACVAVAILDRAVEVILFADILLQIRMAGEAKLFLGHRKHARIFGSVNVVAFVALAVCHRRMLRGRVREFRSIGMTPIAQPGRFFRKQERRCIGVRIVAIGAFLFYRGMDVPFVHYALLLLVAQEAQFLTSGK